MILIFDVILGFLIGNILYNKNKISSFLGIFNTIFLFIITKAVLLGIFLGFFEIFFQNYILIISFLINLIICFFIYRNKNHIKKIQFSYNKINIFFAIFILLSSVVIYNIIPFGGDELMYHLPISIELLNKGSWKFDLGLSPYWYNDIWQWYPKNLYFTIDYFFINIKNIIGFQLYGIFAFIFFVINSKILINFLLEKNKITNNFIKDVTILLLITTPVIFLHSLVKVDLLLFGLINLFTYILLSITKENLNFEKVFALIFIFFLSIGFKIIAFFFLGLILIAYFVNNILFDRKLLLKEFKFLIQPKVILSIVLLSCIFLYSFIFNFIVFGDFLYPIGMVGFKDNTVSNPFFGITNYLKDFIFSSFTNYSFVKNGQMSHILDGIYNFERGLGFMGIFFVIGIILRLIIKQPSDKIDNFIGFLLILFIIINYSKLNILFGHRYQFFIYTLLAFLSVKSIYILIKEKIIYILFPIFFINLYILYPNIGIFIKHDTINQKQIFEFTTPNYCKKITNIGDLGTNHFRLTWQHFCENISNESILLKRQNFNFYFYGKNFDNTIYNNIFHNYYDYKKFINEKNIKYIVTSNKNNLYGYFNKENNSFSTNFSINDENANFCKNINLTNIKTIKFNYFIEDEKNLNINFGINNFDENILLTQKSSNIIFNNKNHKISNICFNLLNIHKQMADDDIEKVNIENIEIVDTNDSITKLTTEDFILQDSEIEDSWLKKMGYEKILIEKYLDDYINIWKKP